MSRTPRWLWVSAEISARRTTGLLVYSWQLSSAVAARGVDLTVVGLGVSVPDREGIDVRGVDAPLRGGWSSVVSTLPNLTHACAVPPMRAVVAGLLEQSWDVIVIDHLQAAWVVSELDDATSPVVFVTHNHESSMRQRIARDTPWWKPLRPFLTLDAFKASRLERRTARRADVVTSITEDDRGRFEGDAPQAHHIVLTPGWSGDSPGTPAPSAGRPRRVGMLGSFEWHVKQENLRRFLTAADPLLCEAGIEILIAGSVPDDFRRGIEPGLRATRFLGWVDDRAEFLASCRFGVVAEPLGGGFKLKALDYVFQGVAVAATAGSVSGMPLEPGVSMVEESDDAALAHAIVALIDDPAELDRMAERALAQCEQEFSWDRRAESLIAAVDSVRSADTAPPRPDTSS